MYTTSCCGASRPWPGCAPAAPPARPAHALVQLESHSWLLDYYQVHIALVELHLAALAGEAEQVTQLRARVISFAEAHGFPFFGQLVQGLA